MPGQTTRQQIEVVPDREALVRVACELITAAAAVSMGRRGAFRIALAGGSTPRPIYAAMAEDPYIDWSQWQLFWSDERCVPPTSPDSNYRMVKEALLDRLPQPPGLVFRMAGEGEPAAAAAAYERTVCELVPPNPNAGTGDTPRFDMILLGMGADGHTASLFPGTAALGDTQRLVVANEVPKLGATRLTFTYRLINAARRVLILVSGAEKAAVLREVLNGPRQVAQLPVQGVQPIKGTVTWLVDEAAYGEVSKQTE